MPRPIVIPTLKAVSCRSLKDQLLNTSIAAAASPAADDRDQLGDVAASALNLTKVYGSGKTAVRALDGVSVNVLAGALASVLPGRRAAQASPTAALAEV